MVRSAPPPNVSLPEVTTAPLIAASAATFSTIASISSTTDMSMTFIDLPGMSQVISAMPSASTSNLKLDIRILLRGLNSSVRRAVFVQDADRFFVALEFQVVVGIVCALARRARADFEIERVAIRFVDKVMAVRNIGLAARAVA